MTDTASCPLSWRLFLPPGWHDAEAADEEATAVIRARWARAGIPDDQWHRPKWRLALDMLAELADWELVPSVVVADAGFGTNAAFREQLTAHGWSYVCQVNGDLTAHPLEAVPELVDFSALGPHPKPRYRTRPVRLRNHVLSADHGAAVEVTWRGGLPRTAAQPGGWPPTAHRRRCGCWPSGRPRPPSPPTSAS